jgi:VIT1/CCC1 family predicted Fe2+/Mn2+ transporter
VADPAGETRELAAIYCKRGLNANLSRQVAPRLMEVDAIAAHARDELGLCDLAAARPAQAALTSAASFAVGAMPPVAVALFASRSHVTISVVTVTLLTLLILGLLGARAGGAPPFKAAVRVLFWGSLAMAVTALIGRSVGATL